MVLCAVGCKIAQKAGSLTELPDTKEDVHKVVKLLGKLANLAILTNLRKQF